MDDFIFKQVHIDDDIAKQLIDLSQVWVEEDISFGLIKDTIDDLKEPLFVCLDKNKIVGYTFGHFENMERKISYIPIGSKVFVLDELYVLPSYRNKQIGSILFSMIEENVKENSEYITLSTSTKDYEKVLNFYCKKLNLIFHSAYLIKKNDK